VQCLPKGIFKEYSCPSALPTKCTFTPEVCPPSAVTGFCDLGAKSSQVGACYNPDNVTVAPQCLLKNFFGGYRCPSGVPIKCSFENEQPTSALLV
jgi:hypothetical protein